MLWFAVCRLVFICYNHKAFSNTPFSDTLMSFVYGARLDLSMSGYIISVLLLTATVGIFIRRRLPHTFISVYYYILIIASGFITIADCELYRKWGNKINSQLFVYLSHPKEMMISAASSPILLLSIIMILLIAAGILGYRKWMRHTHEGQESSPANMIAAPLLIAVTFLFIRGNLGVTAINQSMVYFSNTEALNTAAVNSNWNALYYVFSNNEHFNPDKYRYMTSEEADALVSSSYKDSDSTVSIFSSNSPNVVIIMLESWTASASKSLTGLNNLTPEFDQLLNDGILWDSTYASGNRTEKGLVAIVSGFPAQPVSSVITEPDKVKRLPSLCRDLKAEGYATSFFYGGESEFANMKSYLLQTGFEQITDKNSFSSDQLNSKWGAHDEFVFLKALDHYKQARQPFFSTIMTLSSHEPFEVPGKTLIHGGDEVSKFKNSLMYSDRCLGNFIREAKKQPWYNNTVFVLVADHGHEIGLENVHFFDPVNFRIPLLITGGAVKPEFRGKRIHTIASQTDIAATILAQLGLNRTAYYFSADLCNMNRYGFAHFEYSDGFGFTDASCELLYDNNTRNTYCFRKKHPNADSVKTLTKGKAYQQKIIESYLDN